MNFRQAGGAGQRRGFEGQRGGFAMGLIVGLLVGLALALGVALYVTKVPVPFVNKVPQRTAEQDAAEIEKNKNWDPNSPLYGKHPAKPGNGASAVSGVVTTAPAAPASALAAKPAGSSAMAQGTRPPKASAPSSARDPAVILGERPALPVPSNLPTPSTKPGADPFMYLVQAGAYARPEDAEQQRARLAMQGFAAKVTEREQAGRTVYRVRLGPFDKKDEADATKEKLDGAGVESALVRVQK
jgi:cell division protein FtsN